MGMGMGLGIGVVMGVSEMVAGRGGFEVMGYELSELGTLWFLKPVLSAEGRGGEGGVFVLPNMHSFLLAVTEIHNDRKSVLIAIAAVQLFAQPL
jgi:hypothetical protein